MSLSGPQKLIINGGISDMEGALLGSSPLTSEYAAFTYTVSAQRQDQPALQGRLRIVPARPSQSLWLLLPLLPGIARSRDSRE